MAGDLERALSKLRTDDQVLGYSLMTKVGRPFVSFSFPGDLFPRIKDSIKLYRSDLRLMTIDTEKGLVVLSPVDANWILTVLYVPELQLGLAIAKTKNVLRLLEGIELPPPPVEFEDSAESNLQALQSIAMKATSTAAVAEAPTAIPPARPMPPAAPVPKAVTEKPLGPGDCRLLPTTVPKKGDSYHSALSLDSALNSEMKSAYRNFGFDVLMLVDGNSTVTQIAESMFQPNERVASFLKWAASKGIVSVPETKETTSQEKAAPSMGRFVKCPLFEGDLSKVKTEDSQILALCDGSKTPEEIAEATGNPPARVIQVLAQYRRLGLKMIGKTI